jgi:hypothetical protein
VEQQLDLEVMQPVYNLLAEEEKLTCRADGVHLCNSMFTDIFTFVEGARYVNSMVSFVVAALQRCLSYGLIDKFFALNQLHKATHRAQRTCRHRRNTMRILCVYTAAATAQDCHHNVSGAYHMHALILVRAIFAMCACV